MNMNKKQEKKYTLLEIFEAINKMTGVMILAVENMENIPMDLRKERIEELKLANEDIKGFVQHFLTKKVNNGEKRDNQKNA